MWSGRTAPGYRLPLAATRRVARLNARERPLLHSSFVQIICTNTPLASGRRDGRKGSDMAQIDRSKVAQALAKAIAYKQCGKDAEANAWARQLVELLECHDILAEA
jgi:hypothetical protein